MLQPWGQSTPGGPFERKLFPHREIQQQNELSRPAFNYCIIALYALHKCNSALQGQPTLGTGRSSRGARPRMWPVFRHAGKNAQTEEDFVTNGHIQGD
jgi:hypothetical protein